MCLTNGKLAILQGLTDVIVELRQINHTPLIVVLAIEDPCRCERVDWRALDTSIPMHHIRTAIKHELIDQVPSIRSWEKITKRDIMIIPTHYKRHLIGLNWNKIRNPRLPNDEDRV